MDLLETLRVKIESLEEGDHSPGLRAVLLHIGTAFRHLSRGQGQGDETAFTDAIYRTNQAFEGSVKGAYRVLASKDPEKVRPFDIEGYLEKENVFRPRVLAQCSAYRREWRNPSTHDYKLDFDEGEAFLAIISVSGFACLLIDQIAERRAFLKSKEEAEASKISAKKSVAARKGDLLDRVVTLLQEFAKLQLGTGVVLPRISERQLIGSIAGFLESVSPSWLIESEVPIDPGGRARADFVISDGEAKLLMEVGGSSYSADKMRYDMMKMSHYMELSGIRSGVIFSYAYGNDLEEIEHEIPHGRIVILRQGTRAPNPEPAADG